jgi:hypothetical protein
LSTATKPASLYVVIVWPAIGPPTHTPLCMGAPFG